MASRAIQCRWCGETDAEAHPVCNATDTEQHQMGPHGPTVRSMNERIISTRADLNDVLGNVDLAPSAVTLREPKWEIVELPGAAGWLVQLTCIRPDTLTGVLGRGGGRKELIERGATESAVVKTAWLLFELYVRHEAMESFTYRGLRIFDPHKTVDALAHEAREVP